MMTNWTVLTEAHDSLRAASTLTDAQARALRPVAEAIVEPLRNYGAYAAALPTEPTDGDAASLLRFLGRNPARLVRSQTT